MKKMLLVLLCASNIVTGMSEHGILKLDRDIVTAAQQCSKFKAEGKTEDVEAMKKQIRNLNKELIYLTSKPAENCAALQTLIAPILGENCEIRILEDPSEFLKMANPREYARLHEIFFDSFSREKIATEILDFTNHCEFVGLIDRGKYDNSLEFKSLVQGILIEMASKSVYRNQIFYSFRYVLSRIESSE